jgi:hypothetical protein
MKRLPMLNAYGKVTYLPCDYDKKNRPAQMLPQKMKNKCGCEYSTKSAGYAHANLKNLLLFGTNP